MTKTQTTELCGQAVQQTGPLLLTNEERAAVAYGIELIREWHAGDDPKRRDEVLRDLLERTK